MVSPSLPLWQLWGGEGFESPLGEWEEFFPSFLCRIAPCSTGCMYLLGFHCWICVCVLCLCVACVQWVLKKKKKRKKEFQNLFGKMFASSSTPFGQPTGSPFGSSSVFGQTSEQNRNSFAPKPFGSTTHFVSPTGGSIFGGNSTGVFGASTSPFGATSSPAFGSSNPAFGASSTPAFGSSSSSLGGSSVFGQTPTFGGFGSSPNQTNLFAGSSQQTQPTFGSSTFGSSSPFGASSQPAFGATSTAVFGLTSSPSFGSTGTAFGVSNAPAFGSGGAFGASSTPSFGATSSQGFSFGSTQTFGQSTSAAGSSLFGTGSSFSTQTSPFVGTGFGQSALGGQHRGSRVAAYTLTAEDGGNTQSAGRLVSISAMPVYREKSQEELRWEDYQSGDKGGRNPVGQPAATTTQSNPFGPSSSSTTGQLSVNPFSSSTTSNPFAPKPNSVNGFSASSTLSNPPFSPPTTSNPFGPTKTGGIGFNASSTQLNPFGPSTTSNPFGPTKTGVTGICASTTPSNPLSPSPSSGQQAVNIFSFSTTPNPFSHQSLAFNSTGSGVSSTPTFNFAPNSSPSPFATSSSPAFPSSPSIFSPTSAPEPAQVFKPGLSLPNNQSFPTFPSPSSLGQTNASFLQSPSLLGPSTAPSFSLPNMFSSASSLHSTSNPAGFCQTTSSFSTPFQPAQTAHPVAGFPNTKGQSSAAAIIGQNTFNQPFTTQSTTTTVGQTSNVTSPFGILPAVPQMSIGQLGSAPSVQHGISSMPVSDKPTPVGISSFLTSRHLYQRRVRLPARKYDPKSDRPKVPFFRDHEEIPSTNNADALFMPRENPRALVIRPTTKMSLQLYASVQVDKNGSNVFAEVSAPALDGSIHQDKDENSSENGTDKATSSSVQPNIKPRWVQDSDSTRREDSHFTVTEHTAGEAATEHKHGFDGKALIPKLKHSDYYTEPPIHELAAKERAEPGFCSHVKDFVIGRHGYGKIEFWGETDVQRLDLNALVQFNNREVIVYMDESKKPPVGHGLNKPAEVTLLNILCIDKKTGKKYTDGPQVDRYRDMLKKMARDQGAEFVLYNPVEGEWKFRVQHFSQYEFKDENTYI